MFDDFLSGLGNKEKSPLTTLDLQTPPPPKKPVPDKAVTRPVQRCGLVVFKDDAHKAAVNAELSRRFREWTERGPRPTIVFFGVLPQQGLPMSVTTPDGKQTILLLFDSVAAAQYAFETSRMKPQVAGCRVSSLPDKAEKWISGGINYFAVNTCRVCGPRTIYPAHNLHSPDQFSTCYGNDGVQRMFRGEMLVRQAEANLGKDPQLARVALEYLRDHFEAANPYVYWMIAVLAGMAGDMKANAEGIARLEKFGPPFVGKLQGTAFDMSPGSQFSTFPEAMFGLLMSYGLVRVPDETPPAQ